MGVEWSDVAQDRDKLRSFVNKVMNLRIYKIQGNTWPAEGKIESQKGPWLMELVSYLVS